MIQVTEYGLVGISKIVSRREVTPAEAEANRAALAAAVASGDRKVIRRAKSKPRKAICGSTGILPISNFQWRNGVHKGIYPKPIKLGPKTIRWRLDDVLAIARRMSQPERTQRKQLLHRL